MRNIRALPRQVATTAENFSKERFRAQGWHDTGHRPWPARKVTNQATPKDSTRAILVKNGFLRRSIKGRAKGFEITLSSDMPYAQIHNEGGDVDCTQKVPQHNRKGYTRKEYTNRKGRTFPAATIQAHTVKAHTRKLKFTMPKRQFMGHSAALDGQIKALVDKAFNSALK